MEGKEEQGGSEISSVTHQRFATNDGVELHFTATSGKGKGKTGAAPVILLHGWTASLRFFDTFINELADSENISMIYALDQRFHGLSDKPDHGFHISRLAMDLKNFLDATGLGDHNNATQGENNNSSRSGSATSKPIVAGFSMGCAVIWSFVELFGDQDLQGCIFVDQAPCQFQLADWDKNYCSKGVFDDASLKGCQEKLDASMEAFAVMHEESLISLKPLDPKVSAVLKAETMKCNSTHLGKLMADHARLDWRPILKHRISIPCLNCYGSESACFAAEGLREVTRLIPNCTEVCFEGCNHWLYLEKPQQFVSEVHSFLLGVSKEEQHK